MYCAGAPATHYFPVSIPYHGCALNITVQSYLDQLDFGLVACSETVPDAQRIADLPGRGLRRDARGRRGAQRMRSSQGDRGGAADCSSTRGVQAERARRSNGRSARVEGRKRWRVDEKHRGIERNDRGVAAPVDGARAPAAVIAEAQGLRPKVKRRKLGCAPPTAERAARKAPGAPALECAPGSGQIGQQELTLCWASGGWKP